MDAPVVPREVADAVARFLRARNAEPPPRSAAERLSAVAVGEQEADEDLVRSYEQAVRLGRTLTADNLASTLLTAAARYAEHADYQPAWRDWTPFGDLSAPEHDPAPGSDHRRAPGAPER